MATEKQKKRRRRFGDRRDGRRLRSLSPMGQLIPYIMKERSDSQNHLKDSVNVQNIDEYIREKRREGYGGFGIMHVIIAAYIRTISQFPGLNRFVSGQKIYSRDGDIQISLVIKKDIKLDSPDTVVKAKFTPEATALDVYNQYMEIITGYRTVKNSKFDDTAKILNYIPGLIKRGTFDFFRFLDYFGLLPKFLTSVSPFHGSLFLTSMGSLGIPPIYHHLYNFGNVPVFCAFGVKRYANEIRDDGSVERKMYVDMAFVTDERICDGYYFAAALKYMRTLFANPRQLDAPPTEIKEDAD